MKMAIISDVHGNLDSLLKSIKDAKRYKVDKFIFLGDYITDSEYTNEIVDIIRKEATIAIIGNREKYLFNYNPKRKDFKNYRTIAYTYHQISNKNFNYLKALPEIQMVKIENYKFLILHGDNNIDINKGVYRDFDRLIEKYDFDICLFGHIHKAMNIKYRNHQFINPGSIGAPGDEPFCKYAIIEVLENDIKVFIHKFDISIDFLEYQKNFMNTKYYQVNPEWSNLLLKGYQDGNSCIDNFMKYLDIKVGKQKLNADEYNNYFDSEYQYTIENYNNIDYKKLHQLFKFYDIKKIDDLMFFIKKNFTYGYIDIKGQKHFEYPSGMLYYLQSPIELFNTMIGISFDIIELCRFFFKTLVMDIDTYFFYDNENIKNNHPIIIFYENDRVYWFEPHLNECLGIHEYLNIEELLLDVQEKIKAIKKINHLSCYLYRPLKYHTSIKQIYNHIKKGFSVDLASLEIIKSENN